MLERKLIPEDEGWKQKVYRIIYYTDTKAGKLFDVLLLIFILISTILVVIESIPYVYLNHYDVFYRIEWIITILFTIEYILRIISVQNRWTYVTSTMGVIDLVSILPFYISLLFPEAHFLIVIRLMRLLRVFRIFKMMEYMKDGYFIISALRHSYRKIFIFLLFIIIVSIVLGSVMYIIEGGRNGFESIPQSIYWAVVTITTVGYGDVSPATPLGKFFATILMLCGYGIIAVPTGILTSEMSKNSKRRSKGCSRCGNRDNDGDARYCKICGERLLYK